MSKQKTQENNRWWKQPIASSSALRKNGWNMLAMLAPVCEAKMGQKGTDTHHTTALCILLCTRPA